MAAHVRNLHMADADVAAMASRINVPAGKALAGVYPALVILLGTDDPSAVKAVLLALSSEEADFLVTKVEAVVKNAVYPIAQSVWQFNDPEVDLGMFRTAFARVDSVDEALAKNSARVELMAMVDMIEDSFPYIDVLGECLPEDSVLEFTIGDHLPSVAEPSHNTQVSKKEPHQLGADAVILPSIAIGSLYILSTKIKTFGES